MEQFIFEDMRRTLDGERISSETSQYSGEHFESVVQRLNAYLNDAESKAVVRERIGPLNPHINTLNGSKWKVFIKRIVRKFIWWFIRPIVEQQSWYNELSNAITNELRDSICLLKDLTQENQHLYSETERVWISENERNEETSQKMAELELRINTMSATIQDEIREVWKQCVSLKTDTQGLISKIQGEFIAHREKLPSEKNVFEYIDYCSFENNFRGTQEEIRTRVRRYLNYFQSGEKVIDLGCGRGEWLELLMDYGINAVGVDISEGMISVCKQKGLNVKQGDLFHYLESQPDRSLDGITAIQVIEQLTPVALARLVQLCYRKLKLGGRVIFETQNPVSVSAMTNNFYVDPTHIRPVHPKWVEYLFKTNFFTKIYLEFPDNVRFQDAMLPSLLCDDKNISLYNQRIDYLNNLLYGSAEYTIIAQK